MVEKSKLKITLFSGGSGNTRFIDLLKNIPNIELSILVNGYDDGKSTGEIRKFIPGMLGPSDFRKNFLHLINKDDEVGNILYNIFNYRFPKKVNKKNFIDFLKLNKNNVFVKLLKIYYLPFDKFKKLNNFFKFFLYYYVKRGNLKLADISLGNIIIAAIFLKNKKKFNLCLIEVGRFLDLKHNVYNITNGENLFLIAILENGDIIESEADLVEKKHEYKIQDIYLFKKKKRFGNFLKKKNFQEKIKYLKNTSVLPCLNSKIKFLIKESDIIIYGPGTQHSSLYPSYITRGLKQLIETSKAKKFLITNIFLDNDIAHETVETVINKFYYFFNTKNKNKNKLNLVDFYLVNKLDKDDINLTNKNNYLNYDGASKKFKLLDWEKGAGLHYPNWLATKIFELSNRKDLIRLLNKSVISIIIPCLNESRTVQKVINQVQQLRFKKFNLVKEIIVVDGGSSDGSVEIIKKFNDIKFYKLTSARKGEVLKFGINKSKGDIIVFYPSDNEYNVGDIEKVVEPIMMNQSRVVYGSRMIKCLNLDDQLNRIYKNDKITMLLSKYGGKLINLVILALYNKSISDPFSSLKAFDAQLLKNIKLYRKGFDLDFEIFTKLNKQKNFFLEVPVLFKPRSKKLGKKISSLDGLKCLFYLIFNKFYS